MTETNIILAVIGMIGLFATATIWQRANRITDRYYKANKINRDLITLNNKEFNSITARSSLMVQEYTMLSLKEQAIEAAQRFYANGHEIV
jgi:hypothetical protein